MMDNFMNPFEGFFGGGFGFPRLMGASVGGRDRRDQQLFPYGGFGFPDIGSMFAGMVSVCKCEEMAVVFIMMLLFFSSSIRVNSNRDDFCNLVFLLKTVILTAIS